MINATHTPGPWRVDPEFCTDIQTTDGLLEIGRAPCAEDGGKAASLPHNAPPIEEAVANARLIAAAPDLLEALKNLAEYYRQLLASGDCGCEFAEDQPEYKKAMAAIAKATDQ